MIWRSFLCSLALLSAFAGGLDAQSLRIVTASMDGFDAASTDAARWEGFASVLRGADADLVAIEGISQREQVVTLVSLLKPASYQLAAFGAYTNAGTLTILSKRQPFGARSAEWRATGQMELPGGFAFAGFRSGTNAFCLYVANLPGNGAALNAAVDPQAPRRREIAAQYLAQHVQWMNSTLSNHLVAFCIIGDLVAETRPARLENAGRILQQAGFGAWLSPVPPAVELETPFSALLARGAVLRSAPAIIPQSTLRQPVCVYEIHPGGKPGALASGEAAVGKPASWPGAAVLWIWSGVIAGVCALTFVIWWLVRRSTPSPAVFRSSDSSQLVLEVDEVPSVEEALRAKPDSWQARALEAEQRVEETAAQLRTGLLQQWQSLVRDRFVGWLAAQRGKLLASHHTGAEQVLELEERLQKIQGHFEEQIQNRDQRITELEREIQAKETLIRKLLLARANPSNQSPGE
jgi:hypothetical protein